VQTALNHLPHHKASGSQHQRQQQQGKRDSTEEVEQKTAGRSGSQQHKGRQQ
jgi:hypothetical protein